MRRVLILCCAAAFFLAGCGAYRGKPKTAYWVEAYQDGQQIGIWKTAPGSVPYDDFGTIKFVAENGEQVVLQGKGLTIKAQEAKESVGHPYKPDITPRPAPKAAPSKKK
ncbi:MAG: hypothetical protein GXP25_12145 [Planctomycetes bacterium]|nr:hypothetical protein [Planctomycetota bacterium]